jgi:putative ABC transport system ATP-binding protein
MSRNSTARHRASTVRHEMPATAAGAHIFPVRADARICKRSRGKAMTALVSLKGIVKRYIRGKQRVQVLHGIDLEIGAGEFLALMGPSGSGKTTLLNLIGGIDRADEGDLLVAGERINALTTRKLARWRAHNVGFVFQFYNLMPLLTAEQNVELPLLMTSLSKAQRSGNVKAALELVGLADRATHRPAELSGGQQQRVAIARALVADPTLLVCDEPTGDLDREMAEQILDLLQIVNREQNKTIIMVTHDPKAAERATRQLHLDKGRL